MQKCQEITIASLPFRHDHDHAHSVKSSHHSNQMYAAYCLKSHNLQVVLVPGRYLMVPGVSHDSWRLSRGFWRLSYGFWRLSHGFWRLSHGFWRLSPRRIGIRVGHAYAKYAEYADAD